MEVRAKELIREADANKTKITKTAGKSTNDQFCLLDANKDYIHSAMVDENYLIVAVHVDEVTQYRIEKGEYEDFARLIPRDRIQEEEDCAM